MSLADRVLPKVVYMSSSFWHLAPESRDLFSSWERSNCLLSWANKQNGNFFTQNDNFLHPGEFSANSDENRVFFLKQSIGFIGTPSTSGTAIVQQQPTLTPTVISTDQQQQTQPALAVIGGAVPGAQAALPTPTPATPLTSGTFITNAISFPFHFFGDKKW